MPASALPAIRSLRSVAAPRFTRRPMPELLMTKLLLSRSVAELLEMPVPQLSAMMLLSLAVPRLTMPPPSPLPFRSGQVRERRRPARADAKYPGKR